MSKDVLVTGGGGFIGTSLMRSLGSRPNLSVSGIDSSPSSKSLTEGCVQIDLLDQHLLRKFLVDRLPQVIFHLAGGRADNIINMVTANILTSAHLFEVIRSISNYHPRVIVIGSAAEYGESPRKNRPILESTPAHPQLLYGWVKLLETRTAIHYAGLGLDIVVARLFNIYGPDIPQSMAAGKFAREITELEKQPSPKPLSVGNLSGVRDFMDIRDICDALNLLSIKGQRGQIYNICSQKGVLMRDLLGQMISISLNPSIIFREDKKSNPGVLYSVGSCAKFNGVSGWRPAYDLHQSIRDTLEYCRQRSVHSV
jgi:nucleoside-diphosphate-sugar epimerase